MTKEEFVEMYSVEDGTIILEDWETYSKGIIGVTEDRKHIVYGYNKRVAALAEQYCKDCEDEDEDAESEAWQDAIDMIEFNTIRSLPYMDAEYRPVIVMETMELDIEVQQG